ncbi:MAG: sulfotransferase [Deltaproteobacteria bacterium]|nr:sulfotransferase [Deltaproteobacteria bacterium]
MTKDVTFRDAGIRSPLLRGLNGIGRLASVVGIRPRLDADDIVARAIAQAGSDQLGSDSYREPLERYIDSLEDEANLSTFGRLVLRGMLTSQLVTRIRLGVWTSEHPEAAAEEIRRPWVILGLPRTGTSLLSILLGLDPMARPIRQWEARTPVPPATLAGASLDPRIAEAEKQFEQLHRLNPPFKAMHPTGAMLAEECVPFLMLDLRTLGLETQARVPSYGRWLQDCDMRSAYQQHKRALQALQTGQPTESWVLKTPNHLWCLETLLEFYPDARLIWTHRDPGPVTASVSSLNTTLQSTFTDRSDPRAVGAEWLGKLKFAVDRGMAYDDRAKPGWCVHVHYDELMRDPIAAMRRIYGHFDEAPSRLHERRIEAWLREKPQTAEGRHVYDPVDFGFTYAELAEIWRPYRERFDIRREQG